MPTPDEIYEQVLSEETTKGSSPAVAQARAKAARVRAQKGAADPTRAVAANATDGDAPGTGDGARAQPAAQSAPAPAAQAPAAERSGGSAGVATKAPAKPTMGNGAPATRPDGNGAGPAVPERVQRLLAVVKPEAIQKVERQPMDRVNVWPHLMAAEFLSLLVVMALLTFFSVAVDAPLRELANFNQTPNPSKAPWYFLGLQELLRYFHPQVAGVTIPQVIILGLATAPFIDRNPSTRPDDRKLAIVIFTFFMISFAVLTIIGMFFRGPGFNFTFPWNDGIFFEL
ncbi:MAG: menaquinol-cytochrome c reductase cytochrome b subunit [Actinobacteria bacterium]|nr:menaquinol-cytochrome c reductase cytochrome b subunit [Actinomycetota bacterium]